MMDQNLEQLSIIKIPKSKREKALKLEMSFDKAMNHIVRDKSTKKKQ